jgi:MFS superfamily sulfate permease-like transporter
MKKYFSSIGADLPASIVVFLVAIPLCLGIAVASGVSEMSGIVAGVVGGMLVGLLSGSQLSVSGPAAGLTAVVAASLMKLPSVEAFFLAVVIAGVFQIIMGVVKLGGIGNYVPNSVIKGMLAAIGIILILKQLPHLVGYDKDYEGDETFIQLSGENTFSSFVNSLNAFTPIAFFIGIVGLIILMAYETKWMKSKKLFQLINGPLVVVIVGILINNTIGEIGSNITSKEAHLVNLPIAHSSTELLSFLKFPDWSMLFNKEVWLVAVTVSLVASLETLLSIEAVDKIDPLNRVSPPNRELIAQGAGNIVSGMLGGLPITSVIVRSSANVNSGAKTKMSAFYHGLLILLSHFFFPSLLNMIPKAALAAILVFTGYKLAKVSLFKEYYKNGWDQFIPFMVTIISIVLTDLLTGVLIGLACGVFYIIRSNFKSAILIVKEKDNVLIRFRKDVSFFIKPLLKEKLETIPEKSNLLLDIEQAEFIDKDVIDTINEFIEHAHLKEIQFSINKNNNNPLHKLVHQPKSS